MALFCEKKDLATESDVEQKFIYPFLTSNPPLGLGLSDFDIQTKKQLRRVEIGKGGQKKYYFPDYLILFRGIPVMVVEAKKPGEDLVDGYAEARLYAAEVNAQFPHNINACQYIIVSNGHETWAGYSDQAVPENKLIFDDFYDESAKLSVLIEFCKGDKLKILADKPYLYARGSAKFYTPVSQIGGKRAQDEEMVENSYGRTLVFENRKIFDPETEQDRINIVDNAYIKSAKREQHIEPIYKEIRKFELPIQSEATAIATDSPDELTAVIDKRINEKNEAYSLMLIIGNVGSGKTTFIRYFKRQYLEQQHSDLAQRCEWIFLNMNMAPVNRQEVYGWLRTAVISQIKVNNSDIDFDEYNTIEKLFASEIKRFNSGMGKILGIDSAEYRTELFKILKENIVDEDKYLNALLNYLKAFKSKVPIIVLDNCDKRNRDEQLLMFQVAQWMRTQYKSIVILPMRDSTYDLYRHEPPLDTVVKDLVFRIDPPDLLKVLQARLDYICRLQGSEQTQYSAGNVTITIKREEQIEYFKCIMMAIRQNRYAMDIFYRLSNRNTRNGIQLFEDFCKSGHIDASEFFKIRILDNDYQVPTYMFMNALLRKNRKYFNGEKSNFVNLFGSEYTDDFPDPFVRIDILRWLKSKDQINGPNGVKGLFKASTVVKELQVVGHDSKVVMRELQYLSKRGLVASESKSDVIEIDDLVTITITGSFHLNLLTNMNYLAACAEDILYKNIDIMMRISHRLSDGSYLSKLSIVLTVEDMVTYLCQYRKEFSSNPSAYLNEKDYMDLYDPNQISDLISDWISKDLSLRQKYEALKKYTIGLQKHYTVISTNKTSLICIPEDDSNVKCFMSTLETKYCLPQKILETIAIGDLLLCEVIGYNNYHESFELKFIEKIEYTKK
ncbi:MAG TPA: hypothetical protein GXX35_15955 [Thermoanaerobacterales bacterium]|jgi:Cdc6-like AAA superfamily ATPase|nr:hypothetical protein [Clostridium sp.]HHW04266.1 hypothetical protein [Thermoanaerobacterales bacterium]